MRKLFLISVIILSVNIHVLPQAGISVLCDESWGPGRFNKVTFTINIADPDGFARFVQDFPVGLEVINDNAGNGDFNWLNNQLNIVWMKLPENGILKFSYFIKPDRSMNGNFTMTGRLITVSGGNTRHSFLMTSKPVSIEGLNGLLPEQMKAAPVNISDKKMVKKTVIQTADQNDDVIFRVQVYVSSQRITEDEFIKKLAIAQDTEVKIVQSGKMHKYQAGHFSSYDSANRFLEQIIAKGYKDAFIVAYRGGEQVTVEKALNASR